MPHGHLFLLPLVLLTLAWSAHAQTSSILSGVIDNTISFNQTLFRSSGGSQEYVAVSVVFSSNASTTARVNVTLGSEENAALAVHATREPYFLSICPSQFVEGSYYLLITTDSPTALSFDINAIQESAEIPIDSLVPFVTTTQRYFVFNVAGGSEPDLKIRVERLLGENITEPDKVLAPRDVYVGINRCPESRCPGKGDNSRNTNCGYDARDEPSLRGEALIRSIATPDGVYYVLLQPRDYSPSYLSIIVSSLDRLVVPSISLLVLAVAFVGPSYN